MDIQTRDTKHLQVQAFQCGETPQNKLPKATDELMEHLLDIAAWIPQPCERDKLISWGEGFIEWRDAHTEYIPYLGSVPGVPPATFTRDIPGALYVQTIFDKTVVVRTGDYIVRIGNGLYDVMSEGDFDQLYS